MGVLLALFKHAKLKRRSSNLTALAAVEFLCFWSCKSTSLKKTKTCLVDGLTLRWALQTLQLLVAEQLPIMIASQTDLVIGQLPFSFHATSPPCSPSRLIPKNKPLTTKSVSKNTALPGTRAASSLCGPQSACKHVSRLMQGDEKWQESQSTSKRISSQVCLHPVTYSTPNANLDRPEPPFANLLSLPAFQLSFSTVFITRLTSMKLIKLTY